MSDTEHHDADLAHISFKVATELQKETPIDLHDAVVRHFVSEVAKRYHEKRMQTIHDTSEGK